MIPRDCITKWRNQAPWIRDFQVEQDLVIARALVEMSSRPILAEGLAFRDGVQLGSRRTTAHEFPCSALGAVRGPTRPIQACSRG